MSDSQHRYERIDKGIKRHGSTPGSHEHQPRSLEGVFLPVVDAIKKNEIIDDCIKSLAIGETAKQVAERHGIDNSTLGRWLLSDDRANNARKSYFEGELMTERDEIKTSANPFHLARAREAFRATMDLASRRVKEYAPKQESTVTIQPVFNIELSTVEKTVAAQISSNEPVSD